jgi:hypothetical protein
VRRALATFAIGSRYAALLNVARPLMREYAGQHGYVFVERVPHVQTRPASWLKVPLLLDLLSRFHEVLWLDCDVVIVESDWDIADDVPDDDWQALVRHHTPDGEVPNCGVWYVRRAMTTTLAQMWAMSEYRDHVWWEQAAMLDLLGYAGRPLQLDSPSELYARTCWLGLEWNSHEERDRHPSPRFAHATSGPIDWRLDVMTRYAERSSTHA